MKNEINKTGIVVEERIYKLRDLQVMIDSDLAELYQVSTKRLNEQVKRNIKRFPADFMFQLTEVEWTNLRSQNATSSWGGRRKLPFAFTEHGITSLSGILKSDIAIEVNLSIVRKFVLMRKTIKKHKEILTIKQELHSHIENTNNNFELIFKELESREALPSQGVFYKDQIFDAYKFVSDIIRSAKKSIVLIDNYVDDTVLTHLTKKAINVNVLILTQNISKQLKLDIQKANDQHPNIRAKVFKDSHDRFLIIDQTEVYHIGASLKDLGKKIFAFSKLEASSVAFLQSIKDIQVEA